MFDLNPIFDTVAHHQIRERVAAGAQPRLTARQRPRGRHAWAHRLHALADRLDS
jgi:hypothetical protein